MLFAGSQIGAVEDSPNKPFKSVTVRKKTKSVEEKQPEEAHEEELQEEAEKELLKNETEKSKESEVVNTLVEVGCGVWDALQSPGLFMIGTSIGFSFAMQQHGDREWQQIPTLIGCAMMSHIGSTFLPRTVNNRESVAYKCGNWIFTAVLLAICLQALN